jgi:tetratricopeptide (TPR) repeat protein
MPPSQPTPTVDDSTKWKAARAEAEKLYAKGYSETEEAKALKKAGKSGDAKKKFGKALKRFEGAVEHDPAYYQAWNMVGYCARNTGDLKRAFSAYQKCLAIQPDYDEAHEYLGEAYVQSGDLAKAKIELAWLRANDSDEADELAEIIAAAQGSAAPAQGTSAPAQGTTAPAQGTSAPAPAAAQDSLRPATTESR